MVMASPQHSQVQWLIGKVVENEERSAKSFLGELLITPKSTFTISLLEGPWLEVVCLGIHHDEKAAIFGEWLGPEDQKPYISEAKIADCRHAFFIRSATSEEMLETGCRKAIVYVKAYALGFFAGSHVYVSRVMLRPTSMIGFYNPA